ncbi:hypothetical protein IWQ62_000178 [Dispira parvispora]|uniref:RlpA-like protein double-psi beta-barrel domain-containing protein n=1 Tax=Dispira parvispora TaxID=1520584 RepID=A0A9W8AVD3_9FUNG|nr:hypothetical protein IWQ62_000178 [Dispira parvispora]
MKYLVPITISLVSLVGLAVTHPTGLRARRISSLQTQSRVTLVKRGGDPPKDEKEGHNKKGGHNEEEGNEEEGNEEEGNEEEGDNKENGDTATGPFTGESTYYDATVGTGSCGEESGKDDAVVALSEEFMENGDNSNENPLCGKKIKISVEGYDKVGTATVVDTCPGCPKNNVDINEEWARSMWGEKFMTDGVNKITWEFV